MTENELFLRPQWLYLMT